MNLKDKLNSKQKLALERIYRLFELAKKMQESDYDNKETYAKRYLKLAKKLGTKVNISIPKEIQKEYCKKCFSININKIEKNPFLIVKCNSCNFERKFSLSKNSKKNKDL